MNNKRLVTLTVCCMFAVVIGSPAQSFANSKSEEIKTAEQHFEKAIEFRKGSDYDAAITEYEKVISLSPNSEIAQNARYWIGQSHFQAGRLNAALTAFRKVLDEHPDSKIAASTKKMIERVQLTKQDQSLFEAVEKGDVEKLKSLIAKGADVDAKNQEGFPLLVLAAREGHADIVGILIEKGAEVNASYEKWGTTPLHTAAIKGHVDVVELLIDADGLHPARLNVHARWGHTPMEYAAGAGHKDVVELLLARGADIEAADDWNNTALLVSSASNHLEIVKLLLDRGANVEARVKPNLETPLHRAAKEGHLEVAKLLLKAGAYIDNRCMSDLTPLHFAIQQGHQDMVELLLDQGAMPWRRHYELDLVGIAMIFNQDEMIRFLIDKGIEHSPVHVAAFFGESDKVRNYLAAGGDINAQDTSRFSLLGCAALRGHASDVEFLIKKGADVNQKGPFGGTALYFVSSRHYPSSRGRTEIAGMLLDNGADVNIRTIRGFTALQGAIAKADKGMVEMLIAGGADVNVKRNRRAPWPPDYKFDEDWTLLHNACYYTNPPWREDLEAHQAIVEVLVANGADVNAKTKNGRTPLSLLKRFVNYGHNDKLIELLRKHGAKE